jgi:hypothetical protein
LPTIPPKYGSWPGAPIIAVPAAANDMLKIADPPPNTRTTLMAARYREVRIKPGRRGVIEG